MKKNILLSLVKVLGLCLVFGLFLGVSFIQAAPPIGGNVPQNNPPANNVPGPLNVGPSAQSKAGSLTITGGNLRVTNGGFRSFGPGLFDDVVVIGYSENFQNNQAPVIIKGGEVSVSPKDKKIGFFEKLSKTLGLNTEKVLAQNSINYLTVNGNSQFNGNITTTGALNLGNIITTSPGYNPNSPSSSGNTLCVNSTGNVVICDNGSSGSEIPPFSTDSYHFGGTFTVLDDTQACLNKNPLSNSCACSLGFTKYAMMTYYKFGGFKSHDTGFLVTGAGAATMYGCYGPTFAGQGKS